MAADPEGERLMRVAVIGAGTMGNGIAQVFAQQEHAVRLIDVSAEALNKGLETIRGSLARLVKKQTIGADEAEKAVARIKVGSVLEDAADAGLVVEAASENPSLKFALFDQLDRVTAASSILASNTSSISITEIAAHTRRADKVIGMHFMNPVPVMQLVEVIRGQLTSEATTTQVMELAKALGKTPVEVNDYPGFVSNRVLMPMINEAVFCVMEGVATPEAIDTVMKLGMAHPMGPLALADLIGLDTCLAILEVLHKGLGDDKYRPCPLLRRMVAAGTLGRKTGRGFYKY
jgi:3-hydroxybutyryl-CoA dehydrogenase